MGMTRHEIDRKLDEIIDFAGIERYIDTPVKRFSSGMTVRLGFAVAAFLEPEILVVDEPTIEARAEGKIAFALCLARRRKTKGQMLAVGDAEFQISAPRETRGMRGVTAIGKMFRFSA